MIVFKKNILKELFNRYNLGGIIKNPAVFLKKCLISQISYIKIIEKTKSICYYSNVIYPMITNL